MKINSPDRRAQATLDIRDLGSILITASKATANLTKYKRKTGLVLIQEIYCALDVVRS